MTPSAEVPREPSHAAATVPQQADSRADKHETPAAPPSAEADIFAAQDLAPLSPAQLRMVYWQQLAPDLPLYNLTLRLDADGPLDEETVRASCEELVRRHGALRTRWQARGDAWYQVVDEQATFDWRFLDLSATPPDDAKLDAVTDEAALQPFDLTVDAPLRLLMVRATPQRHLLVFTVHHGACDGWSQKLLLDDLIRLFDTLHRGERPSLPPAPQYLPFAERQRVAQQEGALAETIAWWTRRLQGAPLSTVVPTDRPRPVRAAFRGAMSRFVVPASLREMVHQRSRERSCTPFVIYLAAWQCLLQRHSGQDVTLTGTVSANRRQSGSRRVVGYLANTLALRADFSDALLTVDGLLTQIHGSSTADLAHEQAPLEAVIEALNLPRNSVLAPLFQTTFTLQMAAPDDLALGSARVRARNWPTALARFDLSLDLRPVENRLEGIVEYDTDLYDAATIDRLGQHYLRLLEGLCGPVDRLVATLPMATPEELDLTVRQWNQTDRPYAHDRPVHRLIADRACDEGHQVALVDTASGEVLTLGEVHARCLQWVDELQRAGVQPGARLAVVLPRSANRTLAMLAVFHLGGVLVALEPDLPDERIKFILRDTRSELAITAPDLVDRLHSFGTRTLAWSPDPTCAAQAVAPKLPVIVNEADQPAYIVHTSGSTGTPKGVVVSHRALSNHAHWGIETFGIGAGDRVLQLTSLGFDAAWWEHFLPLAAGAALVVPPVGVTSDSRAIVQTVREHQVTVLVLVPSLLRALLDEPDIVHCRSLRHLMPGGEPLPRALVLSVQQRLPWVRIGNFYGPSEATIEACYADCAEPQLEPFGQMPIGRPIANMRAYVLDPAGRPQPIGVSGELHLAGVGLAIGYDNRPELTNERFVERAGLPGVRLYRTGDRACWRADGRLIFLGRLDDQVKVNGVRLELGEIEALLMAQPGVRGAAACLDRAVDDAPPRLLAFACGEGLDATRLRTALANALPAPVVPQRVHLLDGLPMLPSGKLDRAALVALAPQDTHEVSEKPSNAVEEAIWRVWCELLQREDFGVHDSFFALGGHSLLAMRMVSRLRQALDREVGLADLMVTPTVAGLAHAIQTEEPGHPSGSATEAPQGDWSPLTPAQFGLWVGEQLGAQAGEYHIVQATRLRGPLDVGALGAALDQLLSRHDALRTTLHLVDGQPQLRHHTSRTVALQTMVLSSDASPEAERELIDRFAHAPMNLTQDGPVRAGLAHLGEHEHIVVLVVHHLVCDGIAMGLLLREWARLYESNRRGERAPLPSPSLTWRSWAWRSVNAAAAPRPRRAAAYWADRLRRVQPTRLPIRGLLGEAVSTVAVTSLDESLSNAIDGLAQARNTTPFAVMVTALKLVLMRRLGQTHLSLGTPVAGRHRAELEDLVGLLLNTVVLHTELDPDADTHDALDRVSKTLREALAHQDEPFERIVEALSPVRGPDQPPFFDVLINGMSGSLAPLALSGLQAEALAPGVPAAKFPLTVYIDHQPGLSRVAAVARPNRFDTEALTELLEQFVVVLRQLAVPEARPLRSLTLWTRRAQAQLPHPATPLAATPFVPLPQRLGEILREHAHSVAVEQDRQQWRYAELLAAASALSQRLQRLGHQPGERIAICGARSQAVVVSVLASWMRPAPFLLVDITLPAQRRARMLELSAATWLITVGPQASQSPECEDWAPGRLLHLDLRVGSDGSEASMTTDAAQRRLSEVLTQLEKAAAELHPDDPAHVFFTSGSTGDPKAVLGRQRSLPTFLQWQREHHAVGAHDRVAHWIGLSFDPVLRDIFLPLTTGACLCIPPENAWLHPLRWMREAGITIAHTTPSVMRAWLAHAGEGDLVPSLRLLFVGGEPVSDELIAQMRRHLPQDVRIVVLYGATETTMAPAANELQATLTPGIQPVGRAVCASQLLVLDPQGHPCGIEELGEVHIRGPLCTLGYLDATGRPKGWRPNPSNGDRADPIYATGDLGRWRIDGLLELAGRVDDQVKILGLRVEPAGVATVLESHPAVARALVLPQAGPNGQPVLVAWLVARPGAVPPGHGELWTWAAQHLSPASLPAHTVWMDQLPLMPNGKVDRQRLPAPTPMAVKDASPLAPSTPMEQAVWQVWQQVLRTDAFGVHDHFFLLGGTSLTATQVVARLSNVLGLQVPLRSIFDHPTVHDLAAWLAGQPPGTADSVESLPRATHRAGPHPLTLSQRRMWLVQQMDPSTTAYHMPLGMRLRGPLDVHALSLAFAALVDRHEALRTRIVEVDGEPMQCVEPQVTLPLHVVDLSEAPRDRAERMAADDMGERTRARYDLATAPLFRITLYRLGEHEHLMHWSMHHAVGDGWSTRLLFHELSRLYQAQLDGRDPRLAPRTLDLADYAAWQKARWHGERARASTRYWLEQLADLPTLALPCDRPRLGPTSGRGASLSLRWPRNLDEPLRQTAARFDATPFMVMLAAFQLTLSRWCGAQDVVIGTPIANRTGLAEEQLVGSLVNTLVMRTRLDGVRSTADLLRRVRQTALDAYAHQDLPFEQLVEAMDIPRMPGLSPLFQVFFNVLNTPVTPPALSGVSIEEFEFDTRSTQFDIGVTVDAAVTGLIYLNFATDLFDASTIEQLGLRFLDLLAKLVEPSDLPLQALENVTERDKQLLAAWNATDADYDREATVHHAIAAQAARTPDAPAVLQPGVGELRHGELDARANQLAHALRARGIGRGQLVGLCVERGLDMLVAQLAILKAGAAYVPLDPAYPSDRLTYMAEDAGLALLVSESALVHALPWPREHTLLLDIDLAAIAAQPDTPLPADAARDARPHDGAYVIYTSGSTGKPKGVVVQHQAVVNFLTSMAREPGLSPSDTLLAVTTLSFDIAVLELLLPLTVGARIVLASRDDALDGGALAALIASHRVSVMQATPSSWRMLIEAGWGPTPGFKALIGGEGLPVDLAEQLLERCDALWNMYGPTETTVWSTCWQVQHPKAGIRIGRPIANTTIHILDERLQPCPIGVTGEICIGGEGVTLGYHQRPELTAERFIADPTRPGGRLYRTGDRGRWCHDGTLEHHGRMDFQVKVRGHRIELGEIESQLMGHASVARALVIVREDTPGDQRLVAYLVARPGQAIEAAALREHLKASLPEYMVPQHFVALDAIPLLPNGKVNRHALPRPQAEAVDSGERSGFQAPATETERTIAGIWSALLGTEHIGVHDNFFDLGGHSLLAMRAVTQINKALGTQITVRQLIFESLQQIARDNRSPKP